MPKGFSIATASAGPSFVVASAGSDLRQQTRRQREVDERVRMIVADHAADVLWAGDVAGLEAEHVDDGVTGRGRHGRVLLQLAGDVLAEVVGRPVRDVGPDDGQPGWQQLGLGQLGDRRQSAGGWSDHRRLRRGPCARSCGVTFLGSVVARYSPAR